MFNWFYKIFPKEEKLVKVVDETIDDKLTKAYLWQRKMYEDALLKLLENEQEISFGDFVKYTKISNDVSFMIVQNSTRSYIDESQYYGASLTTLPKIYKHCTIIPGKTTVQYFDNANALQTITDDTKWFTKITKENND